MGDYPPTVYIGRYADMGGGGGDGRFGGQGRV